MKRKAQGAMEYLMTYGWAILVVIIVGIVLWQSGVFGTSSGGVSGFDKLSVQDYVFNSSGFYVKFQNSAGQTLRNVNVNYSVNGKTPEAATPKGTNWAPGKEYMVHLDDNSTCSLSNTGSGYTVDVTITYQSRASISHTETGRIRGKCE
ncbi:MAG: hypothetical protein J7K68_02465 [Candidatus Diapherotrites archaeon]|nr:hypothetical protein [Candidatus Diapherotrites archaeon]